MDEATPSAALAMVPSLGRLAPQLVVAGVLPVVGYSLLRPHVGSDAVALAAVMVFPVAEIAFERLRHGRFEPIGMIALIGFFLGRSFATGDDPAQVEEFNSIWELPGAARRFRVVTAVWGVGLVGEAVVRFALAFTVSTQRFLEISPVLNWGVIGALLWYTTVSVRAGERQALAAADTQSVVAPPGVRGDR